MKIFVHLEKSLKNGFYLDYFFKNFFVYFYKNIFGNKLLYFLDKYIVEKSFFFFKNFFNTILNQLSQVKHLTFSQILKLFVFFLIQVLIIIVL